MRNRIGALAASLSRLTQGTIGALPTTGPAVTPVSSLPGQGSSAPASRRIVLFVLAALIAGGVLAAVAQAAPKAAIDVFDAGSPPAGVAVNQTSGDVYVVDAGADEIERLDADGDPISTFGGSGSAEGQFAFSGANAGVAVAPDGSVYVADTYNNRIQKFDPDGTFEFTFGLDVDPGNPGFAVCTSGCQAGADIDGAADGEFAAPLGVAVDPSNGDVLVADTNHNRIQRFDSSGAYLSQFDGAGEDGGQVVAPYRLAADSTGNVYVIPDLSSGEPAKKFNSSGAFVETVNQAPNAPSAVAVDPVSDHAFIVQAHYGPQGDIDGSEVVEIDSDGALVETHVTPAPYYVPGLAVRSSTGQIYTPDYSANRVFVLDDPTQTATVEATTAITSRTATLNGTVNPGGGLPKGYHFEVSPDGGVTWTSFPETDVDVGDGTSDIEVSQPATGLQPGGSYQVRLVVSNEFGSTVISTGTAGDFTTEPEPPNAATLEANQLRATGAQLLAEINPNNTPTTYYFEYGETAAYGNRVPVGPDASAGSGGDPLTVAQQLNGLDPDTEYHYRVVATNTAGTTEGADVTFRTRQATTAPAGRGFELVSPSYKEGGQGLGSWYGGPDAVGFVGIAGQQEERFALATANGNVLGGGGAFAFIDDWAFGERTAAGWAHRPVVTKTAHGTQAIVDLKMSAATPDFSLTSWGAGAHTLKLFPEMENWDESTVGNALLMRQWAGPGWELFGPTAESQGHGGEGTVGDGVKAVAADGSAIASESRSSRPLAGPGDPAEDVTDVGPAGPADDPKNIYLDDITGPFSDVFPGDDGVRQLVNVCTEGTVLPSGPCAAPAPGRDARLVHPGGATLVAPGVQSPPKNAMSANGTRLFFMSPDNGPGQPDHGPAQAFIRQRGTDGEVLTRWISQSEIAGQAASLRAGVTVQGASRNGDKVFFSTISPLTSDDPNGGDSVTTGQPNPESSDLYMYDLPDGPDGDPATPDADPADGELTRISAGPSGDADCNTQIGTLRYSAQDASRVYFTCAAPIPGAAAPSNGTITAPGGTVDDTAASNLYSFDSSRPAPERTRFVARLPRTSALGACATSQLGEGSHLAANPGGTGFNLTLSGANSCVRGADDGTFVTFFTDGRLTSDDPDGSSGDIYAYDDARGELTRITAPQGGQGGATDCVPGQSGSPQCYGDNGIGKGPMSLEMLNVASGSDGEKAAFFESKSQLVAQDTDTAYDVYEWRAGELTLLTPGGSDPDGQFYVGNDRTGQNVYFATRDQLTWQDKDRVLDVYTARRGGGIPEPPVPAACAALGDGCQGPGGAPLGARNETTKPGGGDAAPPARATVRVKKPTRSQLGPLARGKKVKIKVTVTRPGRVSIRGRARVGGRTKTVLSGSARASKPRTVEVTVRLSRAARTQLRRARKLRVSLEVRASGVRKPVTSSITLTKRKASSRRATAPATRTGR